MKNVKMVVETECSERERKVNMAIEEKKPCEKWEISI